MLIAQRTAEVTWDGSLAGGNGSVTSGSGALANLPVTWAARTEAPAGKTSPEELIAAAHATCFTMALALVLGEAGTPPQRLVTRARCVLEEDRGAPRITRVTITVSARIDSLGSRGVPGSGRCREHALPCIECASRKRRSHRRGEAR